MDLILIELNCIFINNLIILNEYLKLYDKLYEIVPYQYPNNSN